MFTARILMRVTVLHSNTIYSLVTFTFFAFSKIVNTCINLKKKNFSVAIIHLFSILSKLSPCRAVRIQFYHQSVMKL